MNPDVLLAHYDRISEAPDAIPRLRRFILDLAVRGKLVEQDSNDEPASKLVARISMEKRRFKSSVKNDISENVKHSDEAFPLPDTWVWVPATYPASLISDLDKKVHTNDVQEVGAFPVVDQGKAFIRGYCDDEAKVIRVEEPIVLFGDHTREIKLIDFDFVVGADGVKLLQPILLSAEYYFLAIKWLPIESRGYGRHFKLLRSSLIPLPPLAEQHRIVAKVDELMALCDRLEEARTAREHTCNQLVTGSFQRLNQPDEDEEVFREDASFALSHLSRMTTRPAHIKQLRRTILNLAIRGRLVEQDPNDEPALALLEKIQRERKGQLNKKKSKEVVRLPSLESELTPFSLPSGWTWVRFPEVGAFGRGKSKHRPRNDPALFMGGSHLLIQTGDVARSQGLIKTYTNKYNDFGLAQSMKWPAGTLCITIAANIADSGILSVDACFPDSVVGFIPEAIFENARYFEYFVRTAKANLLEFAPATAQKNINMEILGSILIPLPPLAEQHRIVAKVDELMALCDQLGAQLTTTKSDSRRLLEAVLKEALESA